MSNLAYATDFTPSGYFSFRGRITRSAYWLRYNLPIWLAGILAPAIAYGLFGSDNVVSLIVSIACFWPSLAGTAKRLHDRGRSGWFMLIVLVPLIGVIWLIVECGFLRGDTGLNRFGRSPPPQV